MPGDTKWLHPFTIEQLRDSVENGRRFELEIDAGGERSGMIEEYREPTDSGCILETAVLDANGTVTNTRGGRRSWNNLRNHYRYPAESTTRTDEDLTTPAGTFACTLYTVREGSSVMKVWFADSALATPIQMERWHDGERRTRMRLVGYRPRGPGEELRQLLLRCFPDGRATVEGEGDAIELRFADCNAEEAALRRAFTEMSGSAAAELTRLTFETMWVYGDKSRGSDQLPIDLLAEFGPFERLRQLTIFGADYIENVPAEDLASLATSAPRLVDLEVTAEENLGIGRPFDLAHLEKLYLADLDSANLELLGACSFPRLDSLALHLCHGEDETLADHRRAANALFGSERLPSLRQLYVICPSSSEPQRHLFTDAVIAVMPGSPVLRGLTQLSIAIEHTDAQLHALRAAKESFTHLETFDIFCHPDWDRVREIVGDFVDPPS